MKWRELCLENVTVREIFAFSPIHYQIPHLPLLSHLPTWGQFFGDFSQSPRNFGILLSSLPFLVAHPHSWQFFACFCMRLIAENRNSHFYIMDYRILWSAYFFLRYCKNHPLSWLVSAFEMLSVVLSCLVERRVLRFCRLSIRRKCESLLLPLSPFVLYSEGEKVEKG